MSKTAETAQKQEMQETVYKKQKLRQKLTDYAPYFSLLLLIIVFSFTSEGLLYSARNLKSILNQIFPLIIISTGAVFVFAQGNMDISVGAAVGVCQLIAVHVLNSTQNIYLALLFSLLTALIFAFINSWVSSTLGMMPILTSLCMMFIGRGILTLNTTDPATIYLEYDMSLFNNIGFKAVVLIIMVLIMTYLFNFTKLGKYVKAIGGNKSCAEQAGINIKKHTILGYLTMAFGTGIASLFILSRTGTVTRSSGSGLEMDVLIALIFGGISLNGGARSKISSGVVGVLAYVLLRQGLLISGIGPTYVNFIRGILFLIVVYVGGIKNPKYMPR